jgi:hypothetical protein
MIDSDPLFADPGAGDLHLTFPSPCRDSGDDLASTEPLDFEGDPRIAYSGADMGADEFHTHLYHTGEASPHHQIEIKLSGTPQSFPVVLWIGSGVLYPPIHLKKHGLWHLQFPVLPGIDLGWIPSPGGIRVLGGTIPPSFPVPLDLPLQGLIGEELTNLCLLRIR